MASANAILKVINLLADSRPGTKLPTGEQIEDMLIAYSAILEPVPDDLLLKAAIVLARNPSQYQGSRPLPSAGELYSMALELADNAPTVDEAWKQALWLAAHPPYPGLDHDLTIKPDNRQVHPRVRATLEAIGGMQKVDELGILRHQFEEQYCRLKTEWVAKAALEGGEAFANRQLEAPRAGGMGQRDIQRSYRR